MQVHSAPLADRAAVIGQQRGQRQLLAQAVGHGRPGAQQQQQFQGLTPGTGLRGVQGRVGEGRRQPAQALVDSLNVIPRPLVFSMGVEPLLPRALAPRAQRAALHFHQPAHGLFSDLWRDLWRGVEDAVHSAK